jgi:hypothetical protein
MSDSDSGTEIEKIGGNIALINFKLEPIEIAVIKKITGHYVKKISEASNYKELKLRLKNHQHGKSFLHEIEAEAVITEGQKTNEKATEGRNIILSAAVTDYNLFTALSQVLEKIFNEALHRSRTTKEIGEEIKKS